MSELSCRFFGLVLSTLAKALSQDSDLILETAPVHLVSSDSDANSLSSSTVIASTFLPVRMLGTSAMRQFSTARLTTLSLNVLTET